MPKFKLEKSDERIDLVKMIEKLGVNQIFEFSTNNFIPLFKDNEEEHKEFKINKTFQTNLLRVDENGTELISITTVTGIFGCVSIDRTKYMTVDRPFLFIIRNITFKNGKDLILISKIEDISN